jgi:DNA gyrase/topoisomerase IV subunit B
MHDVEMAIQMFNTLFGDDANARWEFIQQHAPELAEGQLDLGD